MPKEDAVNSFLDTYIQQRDACQREIEALEALEAEQMARLKLERRRMQCPSEMATPALLAERLAHELHHNTVRQQQREAATRREVEKGLGEGPIPAVRLFPVAVAEGTFRDRFEAPRQPFLGESAGRVSYIRMLDGNALPDVSPGGYLFVHFQFDRNAHYRARVLPPRRKGRIGMFATRAPFRPNPLGLSLSLVADVDVAHGVITISGADLLDETPIIALQPYTPGFDVPGAQAGWLQQEGQQGSLLPLHYDTYSSGSDAAQPSAGRDPTETDTGVVYTVNTSGPRVHSMCDFLAKSEIGTRVDVWAMIKGGLARNPLKTRTHKEAKSGSKGVLMLGSFKVVYTVDTPSLTVTVVDVVPTVSLANAQHGQKVDAKAETVVQFHEQFGDDTDAEMQ
ncbi:hypothetical protein KIPB_004283 [Kipferlia bialata]|uniref:TsaA-like domain-containing protein n=1 Tax=Kipferlia bialata TaxID=797122 RepID=A0A9K3GI37_9EUKA|nr:hypothetical protein KIPB_004283 [Kipferlia bialata]|eukprot:g4283.t1